MFDQGIPSRPPPQHSGYYGQGFPYDSGYGPGQNMYNGQMNGHPVYPNNFVQQNQVAAHGRLGQMVFALVGQLGIGVLSNMIFGAVFA